MATAQSITNLILSKEVIAAFLGAAAAFLLVVINDWRRQRIKAFSSLPGRVTTIRFFAEQLIKRIDELLAQPVGSMDMVTDWMRPPSLALREAAADVDDLLDIVERAGVHSICFLMDALNRHLRECERMAVAFFATHQRSSPLSNAATVDIQKYRAELQDVRTKAETLVDICRKYRRRRRPWFLDRVK